MVIILVGKTFNFQTDHHSLHSLLHQTIQTHKQQQWLCKLLGYDFDIEYKRGSLNGPNDSLSRVNVASYSALFANSGPQRALWEALRRDYAVHPETEQLITAVNDEPGQYPNFWFQDGILLLKGRVWIPASSALQPLLLMEFHATPTGGHTGIN